MTKRVESGKTETVAEFLKRGGKVTKVARGEAAPTENFVGPARKPKNKMMEREDYGDGRSPNLKWIGEDNG